MNSLTMFLRLIIGTVEVLSAVNFFACHTLFTVSFEALNSEP